MKNNMFYNYGFGALLIASLAISSPVFAASNETGSVGLSDVVATALENNPRIAVSQKKWEEKNVQIRLATALPNPQLGIMKDDIATNTLNPFDGEMTEYTLSQEIMNPSKLRAMKRMAKSDASMAEANYNDVKFLVSTETKKAYYDLLYAQKSLEIGKQNQKLMGQLAQLSQINYSTGMVPLQDSLRAQTEFSKMTTDLYNMAAMESIAKGQLNTLMGKSADSDIVLREDFLSSSPNFDLDKMFARALSEKPSIVSMENEVEMMTHGVSLAKRERLPDFQVSLGYRTTKAGEMSAGTSSWKAEAMIMIPLWAGKNKAKVDSARANLEASEASLENMKNMTTLDLQMALVEAESSWRQIELYKNTILPQAEQAYQAGIVGYTNGKLDFMAVLDSLNTLRNIQLEYYKARINYEKAIASLEQAVGQPIIEYFIK